MTPKGIDLNINFIFTVDIEEVTISPSSLSGIVGQNFSVECSVRITTTPLPENTPTPTFKWFYGQNKSVPTATDVIVSAIQNNSNTYVSTLYFFPLSVSHAGMCVCQFGGNEGIKASRMISLNCKRKCQTYYNYDVFTIIGIFFTDLSLLSVTITSDPASPITEGTAVRLTCTVELNATLIQPPSNLSVVMQRDGRKLADGTRLNLIRPIVPSTTFDYTLQLNSIRRNNAGNYTCRASLNLPHYIASDTLTVTTGK